MSVDKNQAIITYLFTCPEIANNPLFFNFMNASTNNRQIVTVSSDKSIQKPYVDGSVLKQYMFTIIDYKSVIFQALVNDSNYPNENVENLANVQKIFDWIETQNILRNFPNFGTDCEVDEIVITTNEPRLNGVDSNVTPPLAKYSITIQVKYLDKTKAIWN